MILDKITFLTIDKMFNDNLALTVSKDGTSMFAEVGNTKGDGYVTCTQLCKAGIINTLLSLGLIEPYKAIKFNYFKLSAKTLKLIMNNKPKTKGDFIEL